MACLLDTMMAAHILVILCFSGLCVNTAAASVWNKQKSTWETHLVRRAVDTTITMTTLEARTLTRCSFACSYWMGVEALSLYFVQETNACYCNKDIDNNAEDQGAAEIYYSVLTTYYQVGNCSLIYTEYRGSYMSVHYISCL